MFSPAKTAVIKKLTTAVKFYILTYFNNALSKAKALLLSYFLKTANHASERFIALRTPRIEAKFTLWSMPTPKISLPLGVLS